MLTNSLVHAIQDLGEVYVQISHASLGLPMVNALTPHKFEKINMGIKKLTLGYLNDAFSTRLLPAYVKL
ncbi:hypothetical protein Y032_0026g1491 [Ancylostoma ceylanicum]|uniref:Uncharacterized protein n=1 Tax=Ancylostoma ceylanicum TaxID=53326 RepID=A0A016UUW7_9BILA|nr:hypothetical protein Y032_0026g1491 [Ancylostoma ceylanicum]